MELLINHFLSDKHPYCTEECIRVPNAEEKLQKRDNMTPPCCKVVFKVKGATYCTGKTECTQLSCCNPQPRLQQRLSLAQLSNAAQCCHSFHLCKWEIMALMSHFLRNTSGLPDLYSPGPLQGGGPQIPRLPCPPLALCHHHCSVSLGTSVSFIINGCHRKRRGKTPQENSRKTGLESCMWNRMVMRER